MVNFNVHSHIHNHLQKSFAVPPSPRKLYSKLTLKSYTNRIKVKEKPAIDYQTNLNYNGITYYVTKKNG